jgi:hypothetical protein
MATAETGLTMTDAAGPQGPRQSGTLAATLLLAASLSPASAVPHLYHKLLLAQLVSGSHTRLGDALLAAQLAYANSGAFPELLDVYHLFGDPGTSIH